MLMKSPESGFKWWRIRQDVFETQLAEGCVEVRVACDGFEPEDGAVSCQNMSTNLKNRAGIDGFPSKTPRISLNLARI